MYSWTVFCRQKKEGVLPPACTVEGLGLWDYDVMHGNDRAVEHRHQQRLGIFQFGLIKVWISDLGK